MTSRLGKGKPRNLFLRCSGLDICGLATWKFLRNGRIIYFICKVKKNIYSASLACPGTVSPMIFFPLRIRIFPIPDPWSASKNLSILTQKMALSSRKYNSGYSSRIRIFNLSHITDGVKKAPDPGSGSATLLWCTLHNIYIVHTVLCRIYSIRWARGA